MPLMPKRVKHRKVQRGSRKGKAKSGAKLSFGEYGIKSMDRGWIKSTQIEACRVAINRRMKRRGRLWIRIFPDKPITQKPIEVRMGKGKGNPEYWVAVIRPGMMLFEVAGVSEQLAREAMRLADAKLGLRTRFITRED
ncbi:MAG: 50S ribosomal protein L16 [Kiritimatiellia bacterium]|jgi:large subunit ribosomal protein L16|nr:50S ribosomal protein L16 [Kiritimatiellia bacterium]MDP6631620.1 50S ribosomal protein L16 [Kiritimatiellia bacterium]MDP6810219.1 50S ribosomal protein L16 [Kiritimatiellia bacterium]MDP7022875.1 50S ribosomal protein L16 [Kiritimatiellia bacterium]